MNHLSDTQVYMCEMTSEWAVRAGNRRGSRGMAQPASMGRTEAACKFPVGRCVVLRV